MSSKTKKVVIIGAGMAGLRIGQILTSKGMQVELVESRASVGGMLQTIERSYMGDLYRFDLGPHLFFKEYASVYKDLLKNVNGEYLESVEGDFVIKVKDRTLLYPLKIMNMLARLPVSFTQKIIWDLCKARFERKGDEDGISVRQWMSQRFGNTLFDSFFAPYIEKCTGLPTEKVSLKWAAERTTVTGDNLAQTLMKTIVESLKRKKSFNLPSSEQIAAYYPNYGAGRIPTAMAEAIKKQGGKIRLNTELSTVILEKGLVKSIVVTESEKRHKTIQGDIFVSTIPLPNLLHAFSDGIPAELFEASKRLKYRELLLVNIIINRANVLDHLEIFYPDKKFPFKRIYEPKRMSPKMAPKTHSSLVLEICCSHEEAANGQLRNRLIDRSIMMLESEGILKKENVVDCFTIRLPAAYPIYELSFEKATDVIEDFLATIANIISCGRQGLFEYHAMTNETMEIAENVAQLILCGGNKSRITAKGKWSKYFY